MGGGIEHMEHMDPGQATPDRVGLVGWQVNDSPFLLGSDKKKMPAWNQLRARPAGEQPVSMADGPEMGQLYFA